jgi:hypothetical protein
MVSAKIATIPALCVQLAIAASADEIESHHAHEHGVASLNVGIEAGRVELEFDSPAINVIGFEHAPRTDAEKAAASRAQRTLQDARRLFVLNGEAECRATSTEVVAPTWADGESHADYEARYAFRCAKPQLLRAIDVRLVNELAAQTKLRVQIVANGKQTSAELTRNDPLLPIG